MKLVILDGYAANPGDLSWDCLSEFGDVTVYDHTPPEDVIPRLKGAGIAFTNKTVLDARVLEACPELKYIGVIATGYNVVDISAAREHGIAVTNIPGYSTDTVAQYVFAMLLEICHRVGHHNAEVQKGRWTRNRDFCFWDYPLIELKGRTFGVIGYGSIGKAAARIAEAFGMKVLATSRSMKKPGLVPLEKVLAESDIISLHCPLTEENAGMINAESISRMKSGVILINTARGGLIRENDLREALLSGRVYAAASDVVSTEPIREDNPLLGLDNMIITPHIAWASREARQRLIGIAADNVRAWLSGEQLNRIDLR